MMKERRRRALLLHQNLCKGNPFISLGIRQPFTAAQSGGQITLKVHQYHQQEYIFVQLDYNEFHRARIEKENEASKAAQAARAKSAKGEESARDVAKRNGDGGKAGESDALRKGKQISSNIAQNKGY